MCTGATPASRCVAAESTVDRSQHWRLSNRLSMIIGVQEYMRDEVSRL